MHLTASNSETLEAQDDATIARQMTDDEENGSGQSNSSSDDCSCSEDEDEDPDDLNELNALVCTNRIPKATDDKACVTVNAIQTDTL